MTRADLIAKLQEFAVADFDAAVQKRMQEFADRVDEQQRELALLSGEPRLERLRELAEEYGVYQPYYSISPFEVRGFPDGGLLGK